MSTIREERPIGGMARVSAALWRRTWLRASLTLTPPLAWFLVIYIASLALMLVTALWTVNPFTNVLEHSWTFANFDQLFTSTYLTIIARTVEMRCLAPAQQGPAAIAASRDPVESRVAQRKIALLCEAAAGREPIRDVERAASARNGCGAAHRAGCHSGGSFRRSGAIQEKS